MSKQLPTHPSLEHLKKQAKRLLDAARAGDAPALARFRASHPKLGQGEIDAAALALSDAQLVLAREHGFSSWPRFSQHVTETAKDVPQAPKELAELLKAIEKDRLGEVQTLLERKPELLHAHEARFGQTPLHAAARFGPPELIALLLKRGARIEARDRAGENTPLHTAAMWNRADLVRALLAAGADVYARDARGCTPVERPLSYKDCAEVVNLLLAHGAEPTWWTDLAMEREGEIRRRVQAQPELLKATWRVGEYIQIGALHLAAMRDSAKLVDWLVELGVDLHAKDEKGRTPADMALNMGHGAAYERLRAHGADADAKLRERLGGPERVRAMARMHTALMRGDLPTVKESLAADPSLLNTRFPDLWGTGGTFGAAPLHWAAMFNQAEIARYLLDQGADQALRDETYDATPLGWAHEFERDDVAELLKEYNG